MFFFSAAGHLAILSLDKLTHHPWKDVKLGGLYFVSKHFSFSTLVHCHGRAGCCISRQVFVLCCFYCFCFLFLFYVVRNSSTAEWFPFLSSFFSSPPSFKCSIQTPLCLDSCPTAAHSLLIKGTSVCDRRCFLFSLN